MMFSEFNTPPRTAAAARPARFCSNRRASSTLRSDVTEDGWLPPPTLGRRHKRV
jgi:hypothetical protein